MYDSVGSQASISTNVAQGFTVENAGNRSVRVFNTVSATVLCFSVQLVFQRATCVSACNL